MIKYGYVKRGDGVVGYIANKNAQIIEYTIIKYPFSASINSGSKSYKPIQAISNIDSSYFMSAIEDDINAGIIFSIVHDGVWYDDIDRNKIALMLVMYKSSNIMVADAELIQSKIIKSTTAEKEYKLIKKPTKPRKRTTKRLCNFCRRVLSDDNVSTFCNETCRDLKKIKNEKYGKSLRGKLTKEENRGQINKYARSYRAKVS